MNRLPCFLIFLYLFFACNLAMIIMFVSLYILIRVYLLVVNQIPFELTWDDSWKYTKAAFFAGSWIAAGCWLLAAGCWLLVDLL
ncbi:hypothetical protein ACLBW2_19910 [Enterobacteriaceae bacterium C23F]